MTDLITFATADGVTVGTLFAHPWQLSDGSESERLQEAFRQLLADPTVRRVALDLRRLDFAPAALSGKLVWLFKQLPLRDGRLAVCGSAPLAGQYRANRLDTILPVHADPAAAIASVTEPEDGCQ